MSAQSFESGYAGVANRILVHYKLRQSCKLPASIGAQD